jgi:hypothetical protein
MYENEIDLLDLPNEILFFIFKKLENIHVLYSFLGDNNQRLDAIVQDQMFTTNLDFISISNSTDEICSITNSIFNRFHYSILPKIHENQICQYRIQFDRTDSLCYYLSESD